jgi:hypothetical protein
MREAYESYEANNVALALKFMMAVRQTVHAIQKAPLTYPVVFEASRNCRSDRRNLRLERRTNGKKSMTLHPGHRSQYLFFTSNSLPLNNFQTL